MSETSPRCASCRHWECPESYAYDRESKLGECHRYPPVPVFSAPHQKVVSVFPEVEGWNTCGEWAEVAD